MKKLFWVLCGFEKSIDLDGIDFDKLKGYASEFDFEVEFACICKKNYMKEQDFMAFSSSKKDVTCMLFDKSATENQCIFRSLNQAVADRYFVSDIRYLKYENTILEMLYQASYEGVQFVRCKKEYRGIFLGFYEIIVKAQNKISSVYSNAKTNSYVRNLCIFDSSVHNLMINNEYRSGQIRECDLLVNVDDVIVEPQEKIKKSRHFRDNWIWFFVSYLSIFVSIALIVCMAMLPANFETCSWIIVGVICFGVVGVFGICISISGSRGIYRKPFSKRREVQAIWVSEKPKKRVSKAKKSEDFPIEKGEKAKKTTTKKSGSKKPSTSKSSTKKACNASKKSSSIKE